MQSSMTCEERSRNTLEKITHPQKIIKQGEQEQQQTSVDFIRCMGDAVEGLMGGDSSIWRGFNPRKSHVKNVIVPTDFVVVECTLEKKGLPHRLVVEDVVESLTELQRQAMEMQRIAIAQISSDEDGTELQTDGGSGGVRPVLYAPNVVVSHAGVIDAAAHSFQRIRIRGSCVAHVEALARALETGAHFTDCNGLSPMYGKNSNSFPATAAGTGKQGKETTLLLPPNLSFSPTHHGNPANSLERQLLGHRVPSSSTVQRTASGRFHRYQTLRPLQGMVVDKDEREFWGTHYYRLSDIRLVFHDRVGSDDVTNPKGWSSPLKERLLAISQSRSNKQTSHEGSEVMGTAGSDSVEYTEDITTRGQKNAKKKPKTKQTAYPRHLEVNCDNAESREVVEFLAWTVEVGKRPPTYFRVGDK
ncbi:hypothetical protein TRSC58_01863 [Trypanosoma rangeli SC58]|uniref:Uncharacterized protein n=1 Tax=Trypanosoma rangeli SC58 TaxID=429131 RepID=A0A061J8E8_TRYRA|nr:hypothetical protein TRSC58_01863 [Trypanosoma rangeli SC58]